MKWNMPNAEDKILIKTCGNLKDFLPKHSARNTLTKIEKTDKSCAQPVQSNALQEAVGYGHSELQTPLPQLKT